MGGSCSLPVAKTEKKKKREKENRHSIWRKSLGFYGFSLLLWSPGTTRKVNRKSFVSRLMFLSRIFIVILIIIWVDKCKWQWVKKHKREWTRKLSRWTKRTMMNVVFWCWFMDVRHALSCWIHFLVKLKKNFLIFSSFLFDFWILFSKRLNPSPCIPYINANCY